MKKSTTALLAALTLAAAPAFSAEKKKAAAKPDPAQEAMMAKWQEAATPGANHRVLDALAGSWDHTLQFWTVPGGPAEESKGTSEVQWIMGGRFLQQRATGVSMGQPFEGQGLIGYSNVTKQYQSTWVDNMGTGVMTGTGVYDAATKTLTETGSYPDPMSPTGATTFRAMTRIQDNDNHTFEMHTPGPDGKEFLSLKIIYKRKK